jgi:anti-sigma factor ChrR (cupin superfamily)
MDPLFHFTDSNSVEWQAFEQAEGVAFKTLCAANGQTMEIYRLDPNTSFPDHIHQGPEFVYILDGSIRLDGRWIEAGWGSVGETGTKDQNVVSGKDGCLLVSVYTESRYVN